MRRGGWAAPRHGSHPATAACGVRQRGQRRWREPRGSAGCASNLSCGRRALAFPRHGVSPGHRSPAGGLSAGPLCSVYPPLGLQTAGCLLCAPSLHIPCTALSCCRMRLYFKHMAQPPATSPVVAAVVTAAARPHSSRCPRCSWQAAGQASSRRWVKRVRQLRTAEWSAGLRATMEGCCLWLPAATCGTKLARHVCLPCPLAGGSGASGSVEDQAATADCGAGRPRLRGTPLPAGRHFAH